MQDGNLDRSFDRCCDELSSFWNELKGEDPSIVKDLFGTSEEEEATARDFKVWLIIAHGCFSFLTFFPPASFLGQQRLCGSSSIKKSFGCVMSNGMVLVSFCNFFCLFRSKMRTLHPAWMLIQFLQENRRPASMNLWWFFLYRWSWISATF